MPWVCQQGCCLLQAGCMVGFLPRIARLEQRNLGGHLFVQAYKCCQSLAPLLASMVKKKNGQGSVSLSAFRVVAAFGVITSSNLQFKP